MLDITQENKEKFIADLCEDDFREKLVRRLFKALGYKDGRDTCGPEEFGKDAIFVDTDKFGVENFTAVQTKVGSVNLSGDPSKNLHTILAQLRTALDQPHVCTRSKKKVPPLNVYLAASGKINQAARSYIVEKIDDPRLRFLDRDDLIAKIDEVCPELWAGIVGDVSPYLKALANRVEDLSLSGDANPIHSSLGVFAAASDSRFVDVRLGHHKLRIEKRSGQISEEFDYEEISGTSLFAGNTPVRALLLGDAGSGKSTLLTRLAYLIAKKSIGAIRNYRVPVFIRASELVGRANSSIYSVIEDIVSKVQELDTPPFVVDDFEDGRIVLLIDGLDELAETIDRQDVLDFLALFYEEYPKCSIAIASRPYSSIEKLCGLEKFKRYRISPLNMEDASRMLQAMEAPNISADASWRKEILRRLDGVYGIELNPLLVTVFAVSSGHERRDIPANITELFSKFTELMLGRWDEKKGMSQQYQSKVKEHLLAAFAFKLQDDGDTSFSRKEFVDFAATKLDEMNLSADLDVVVTEILDRSGLIRGDADHLEFKHHLLQEFFAAKGMPGLDFVKKVINFEWWRNSIVFYFGGAPSSAGGLLDVATDASTSPVTSFLTIGLALQACYLSKLEERLDVWKWVVEAAASSSQAELNSPDPKYPIISFVSGYLAARDSVALGGIEKESFGLDAWACRPGQSGEFGELRRFWYVVALVELGHFKKALEILRVAKFSNDVLATAVHFGAFFSARARQISSDAKRDAMAVCEALDFQVDAVRFKIAQEFKGQLLEYRRTGVVALDDIDPELG